MEAWNKTSAPMNVIFRFEKAKDGAFKGFVDMPDQGSKDMPIIEASVNQGKLTLKVKAAMAIEFTRQLSGDKMTGEWKPPTGSSTPLTLTKEKP